MTSWWPPDDPLMTSVTDITLKNQTWFSSYYVVFHIVSLTIELSCTRSGNVPNRNITETRSRFWGTNQNQKKRILKIYYGFFSSHFVFFRHHDLSFKKFHIIDCEYNSTFITMFTDILDNQNLNQTCCMSQA